MMLVGWYFVRAGNELVCSRDIVRCWHQVCDIGEQLLLYTLEKEGKKTGERQVIEANNDMVCPNIMFVVAGASLNCILVV
jgi:hypothetical protein